MTRTHEIKLDGYGAHTTLAEDRPIMLLGTAESYGIETLHVVHGESWEGLTITATFNAPDGTSTDMLMSADGSITVPSEATAKSGSGKIVFTGVSEGVQRISCDLEYFVVAHSAINGVQSGGTAPSWFEQAATRFMPPGGTAGQVLTKLTNTDFNAGWQDSQGGAGLAPLIGTTQTVTPSQVYAAIKAGRDIALQHTDSHYGTFVFSAFNANEQGIVVSNSILPQFDGLMGTLLGLVEDEGWDFRATNMATKDDVGTAVNEALAAAKASGEFDGADGLTPTIGDNGNWYLGDADTGKPSRGEKGDKGDKGDTGATGSDGLPGVDGADGVGIQSVVQTTTSTEDGGMNVVTVTKTDGTSSTFSVKNGSKGSKGDTGAQGEQGIQGIQGEKGDKGDTGATGAAGAAGKSAYQYAQDGGYTGTETEFAAKLAQEKFANPNALTFTGAVTGSYDGSTPLRVEIPSGGSGEAWELLYETTLTEDAATFSQEIPACSKVKVVIFPGSAMTGWKRIIINGTSYPTANAHMLANQAYFVSIDTLLPPYITASIGIYINPVVNGINGGYNYFSYGEIGDSITKIGCDTAEMLVTGAIIKIWGVRK